MNRPDPFIFAVRRDLLAFVCVCVWLTGCDLGHDPAALPPIPDINLSDTLPVVREQIESALEKVTNAPGDAAATGRLAMILHTYRYLPAAEVCYQRVRMLKPRKARWAYLHGRVLMDLGKTQQAQTALAKASQLDIRFPQAQLQLARLLEAQSDSTAALSILRSIANYRDTSPEVNYELGRILFTLDQYEEAERHLRQALELGGEFGSAYYVLGQIYSAQQRDDQARQAMAEFERHRGKEMPRVDDLMAAVLELDISDGRLVNRARSAHADGRIQEAIGLLEQALTRNPDSLIAIGPLIALYAEVGRFDLADEKYLAGLKLNPDLDELHYNRGLALSYEQRYVEAIEAFRKSQALNPHKPDTYFRIGNLHSIRGLRDSAIAAYQDALNVAPDYAPARSNLANALFDNGQPGLALPHYERLISTPGQRTADRLYRVARCYLLVDRPDSALRALQEALRLAEQSSEPGLIGRIRTELESLAPSDK